MGSGRDTDIEPPVTGRGTFEGARNRAIHWRGWSAAGDQPPRGTVVIVHGLGEHLGRYEHVAERLSAERFAVYGLDHHGHGRSEGPRAVLSMADAVTDLDQLVAQAIARQPGWPTFMLGHSLGGAITLRYALAHPGRLDGIVLTGPLAAIDAPPPAAAFGRVLGQLAPRLPMVRLNPKWISREPSVVARYITDPLVHRHAIPAATIREILVHVRTLPRDAARITTPALVMYGTEDHLCPPRGSVMLTERLGSEDLTTKAYEGLYHELLNEPERERVLDEIVDWLGRRSGARG